MTDIGGVIVSDEIFQKKFYCNLSLCKGACCIEGDAGAPLEREELKELKLTIPIVKKYLSFEAIAVLENNYYVDNNGELETPLIKNGACAYSFVNENGYLQCAIQKAFQNEELIFEKPISCHLYPIRIKKIGKAEGLNFSDWSICKSSCNYGVEKGVSLIHFLKSPLVRKYGLDWYNMLNDVLDIYNKQENV